MRGPSDDIINYLITVVKGLLGLTDILAELDLAGCVKLAPPFIGVISELPRCRDDSAE